jgi:hypothetical protein
MSMRAGVLRIRTGLARVPMSTCIRLISIRVAELIGCLTFDPTLGLQHLVQ